jgi:drug/metabolite transporter (DMT)-like permease
MPLQSAADKPKQVPVLEYGLLLLLAALWASSFSFIKLAVDSIPPMTTIAIRTAIAGMLLWAIMRAQGMRLPRDLASWKSFAVVSAVNTVAPFMLIAWGLQWIDAGLAVILNSTTPIFAFLITWGLTRHETITRRKLFGVVAGITGIVLIVGASALAGLGQQLVPQLAIVLASLSYATSAIYGRTFRELGPIVPATGSLLIGTLVLTPIALVVEQPWTASPTTQSMAALVVLAVLSTALGNVLYFRLLGTLGSLGTTAQSYLRVPIGVLISMLLLGEQLTSTAWIGLVCVVAGVAAMTMPPGSRLALPVQVTRLFDGRQLRDSSLVIEYALLGLLALLWGSSYLWIRLGLDTLPPLTLMAGRVSTAIVFLAAVLWLSGKRLPPIADPIWRSLMVQGLLIGVIPYWLIAWGQQWVPTGTTAILNSTTPIFAFLITWAITRQEPATMLKLIGAIVGFAGVTLVIGLDAFGRVGTAVLPQGAILLSSVAYAVGAIYSRRLDRVDPIAAAAAAMTCALAVMWPIAIVVDRPWTLAPSTSSLLAMATLGILSTGLGFSIYFRLARTLGPIAVTTQSYLRAPVGVLLGAGILGEVVSPSIVGGLVLVLAGVAAMTMQGGNPVTKRRAS